LQDSQMMPLGKALGDAAREPAPSGNSILPGPSIGAGAPLPWLVDIKMMAP